MQPLKCIDATTNVRRLSDGFIHLCHYCDITAIVVIDVIYA